MLMAHQVSGFAAHGLHRFSTPVAFSIPRSTSQKSVSIPYRDWVPFFNDTYSLSNNTHEFYCPDLLDHVFVTSEESPRGSYLETPPAALLHAEGSLYAELWLEHMGKRAHYDFQLDEAHDTSKSDGHIFDEELISFRSQDSFTLSTPITSIPDEVVKALLELPLKRAQLTPSISPHHQSDFSHVLRTTKTRRSKRSRDSDGDTTFLILLDTGCSVSCSGFKEDFHGQLAFGDFGQVATADGSAKIEGFGMLRWDVVTTDGQLRILLVPGYYSPTIAMRLLSPQDYARYHHMNVDEDQYRGNSMRMTMDVAISDDKTAELLANIDPQTRLPFVLGELGHHDVVDGKETKCHCNVTSIYDTRNINLSRAQKALKLDHDRLGHLSMQMIQRLYQPADHDSPDFDGHPTSGNPCLVAKDAAQIKCKTPVCEACEVARARKRPTGATKVTPVAEVVDGIRAEDLKPGDCVSVDQYESSVRGRRYETYGREREEKKYCGGTLFYDHASGRIFVQHQSSLSAFESIKSKNAFEREATLCGFQVLRYRTDNGIFTSKKYEASLDDAQQSDRAAVGAHHQNGVAESNIGRVQRMSRAMLLHLRLHWPDEFSADLWPFALDYAVYIYNHVPTKGKPGAPSPIEVFCGSKVGCRSLRRLRVFGCPCYVLDPRLQDGKKIPKWEPRSRKGQFLGFSKDHASSVGNIRNIRTGYISPQFHIVYDEAFETVTSEMSIDLEETWIDLFLNARDTYLDSHDESVDGPLPELGSEWLSETELNNPNRSHQGELPEATNQGEVPTLPNPVPNPNPIPQPTPVAQPPAQPLPPTRPNDGGTQNQQPSWHDVEENPNPNHESVFSAPCTFRRASTCSRTRASSQTRTQCDVTTTFNP